MDGACIHNWFAKAAIEMACWDIRGKAEGKPVYELLGGAVRPLAIRSRYSMGAYEPDARAARAKELVAAGFTTIKVKVGRDPAADVERVRAVREAIGPDIALTIDANCGWDADTAIRCDPRDGRLPSGPGRAADARRRLRGAGPRAARNRTCR